MVPRELDQDEGSLDEQSERKRDLQENYENLRVCSLFLAPPQDLEPAISPIELPPSR